MANQVIRNRSYGQRQSGSFRGKAGGFFLFVFATVMLFWNEGNFVSTKRALQEAESVVVRVNDVSNVDPSLNGKLIHASAFAGTKNVLTDELFGIREMAISITRKVEYYQYVEYAHTETRERAGGGEETITTYTYQKVWTTSPVDSKEFATSSYRSSNFLLANIKARTLYAQEVTFGGYLLPLFLVETIGGSIPVDVSLTPGELAHLEEEVAPKKTTPEGNSAQMVRNAEPESTPTPMVHPNGNTVYFGKSASSPNIGDVRVTLTKIMPTGISIIAQVNGSTFEPYTAANGKVVSKLSMGTVSAGTMFADAHSTNSMGTWMLRLIGFLLVIASLKFMLGSLSGLFNKIPFFGKIIGAGVKMVCTIIGCVWSLLVIAIAWLWYRPLVSLMLITIAITGIWLLKALNKEKPTHY